jgi:hypothetical protein
MSDREEEASSGSIHCKCGHVIHYNYGTTKDVICRWNSMMRSPKEGCGAVLVDMSEYPNIKRINCRNALLTFLAIVKLHQRQVPVDRNVAVTHIARIVWQTQSDEKWMFGAENPLGYRNTWVFTSSKRMFVKPVNDLVQCSTCLSQVVVWCKTARWPQGRVKCSKCQNVVVSVRQEDDQKVKDVIIRKENNSDEEHFDDLIPEGAE